MLSVLLLCLVRVFFGCLCLESGLCCVRYRCVEGVPVGGERAQFECFVIHSGFQWYAKRVVRELVWYERILCFPDVNRAYW